MTMWVLLLCLATTAPDLSVDIVGNETLLERVLLAELEFWLEDLRTNPLDEGARDDVAYELTQIYRERGFPKATVTSKSTTKGGTTEVVFTVVEGPRRLLGELTFDGAAHFDAKTLQNAFQWQRDGVFKAFGQGPIVFSDEVLEAGCVGVRLLYRLDGFRDVATEVALTERDKGDRITVDVLVKVTQGRRYRVRDVVINVFPIPPGLREACGVTNNDVFTPRMPVEVAQRVQRFLADRGYFSATADAEPLITDAAVDLHVRFDTGPLATIDSIVVQGNNRTSEHWVRRHLSFSVGDLFSKTEFEKSRSALLRSGLFRNARVTGKPVDGTSNRLDVEVELDEKDAIRTSFRIGFGSYELGRVGVEVLHQNLFGYGLYGRARARASFRGEEVNTTLRVPLVAGRRLFFSIDGGYRRFEEPSFVRQEVKGTAAISGVLPWDVRARTGYEVRDETILDAEASIPAELREDSRSAVLFVSGTRDTRDPILDPSSGTMTHLRIEVADAALGSELDFVRVTGRFSYVLTLIGDVKLSLNARAGVIRPTQSIEIPLGERFFLGGARSHRAFRESELGPKDGDGESIGGEAFAIGNVELRFPIWKSFYGAAFFDAATLTDDVADLGREGDSYGAGGGLMWMTPIGPLRGDIGFNLDPKSGEDHWVIHVLLGHPF